MKQILCFTFSIHPFLFYAGVVVLMRLVFAGYSWRERLSDLSNQLIKYYVY